MISYKYDEIGELTREDNQVLDKTIIYSYDAGGNITEKTEYPYTTGTPENSLKTYSYGYNDSNWKDKLTSFDGKEITYDEIGNPLTYDGYTYTWEAGRQLAGISGNGKNITYKYNESGIRTEKTVDGVTTKYYLGRDKVIYVDNGTDKIYYTYDLSDRLISMNLNGVEYYYVRNGQGDIIGLIDGNGIQIVSYTYNTWGKLISIKDQSGNDITNDTSSVGYKNPYRYRGYRYDTETGLYYLQSRYYNPDMGRFINADDTNVLQTIQGQLLGTNLFAYGNNNPVTNIDPTGYWVLSVGIEGQAAFVIGIYIGVAVSIDGNWNVAISYSIGFAIITNAAASLSAYVAYYRNKKSVSNLSGWGVSVGAAFSVGAHISCSGSLDAGFKGGLGGVVSASYGWGVSLAPIPYYQTRVGYTGIMYKFNLKTLLRYWYNGSSKRIFRFLGLTATITKQSTYVDVYFKFLRKRIRLYNTAKIKIY